MVATDGEGHYGGGGVNPPRRLSNPKGHVPYSRAKKCVKQKLM